RIACWPRGRRPRRRSRVGPAWPGPADRPPLGRAASGRTPAAPAARSLTGPHGIPFGRAPGAGGSWLMRLKSPVRPRGRRHSSHLAVELLEPRDLPSTSPVAPTLVTEAEPNDTLDRAQ